MTTPAIAHHLRRIYLAGLVCASVAASAGIWLERTRFGATDAAAMARVERSLRTAIVDVTTALGDIATTAAREPALFDASAADPAGAGVRALLDRADQALRGRTAGVFAVTAYRPSGTPLAWSGVPSEVPVERIAGPETYFVAPGPLGLRLIYIKPVLDPVSRHRVGVVVAERVVSSLRGIRMPTDEGVVAMPTIVPVTVRPHGASVPANSFVVEGPDNQPLLVAEVNPQAIRDARAMWRRRVSAVVLGILALTLIVSFPPLLRWRASLAAGHALAPQLKAIGLFIALVAAARLFLWLAPTAEWTDQIFQTAALGGPLRMLLRTPVDFLFTMSLLAAMLVFAFDLAERLRRRVRQRQPPPITRHEWVVFAITQLGAGVLVALLLVGYEVLLGNAIAATSVDALHFSLHPLVSARLALAVGLIFAQAVVFWAGILAVIVMSVPWRIPRAGGIALAGFALQAIPVLIISIFPRAIGAAPSTVPALPTASAGLACLSMAWAMAWARPRYRHASQALRLFAGALILLIPAFVLYPSVHHFADRGLRRLIEEEFARQAFDQRTELQKKLSNVLQQIDAAELPDLTRRSVTTAQRCKPCVPALVADRSRNRAAGFLSGALRSQRCSDKPIRFESARLCLGPTTLARAELRMGDF